MPVRRPISSSALVATSRPRPPSRPPVRFPVQVRDELVYRVQQVDLLGLLAPHSTTASLFDGQVDVLQGRAWTQAA